MLMAAWFCGVAAPAHAQVGALLSPGPLARAHASLEGLSKCESCHEPGRRVVAAKCLSCHQPVAQRIARRTGVHRNVTSDCVTCHVEHMGVNAELRPFDRTKFDHRLDAGYPLDGKHAALVANCAACHKTRSFLGLATSCASCHQDPHKGSLGATCTNCHSTAAAFKGSGAGFDHSKAAFALMGAHQKLQCVQCHREPQQFKVAKFASCADCHKDPHTPPLGATCTTCHVTDAWRTRRIDHARTEFPLAGKHVTVDCARCHTKPAVTTRLVFNTCASCHADVHKGTFKQDCKACHDENGFEKAPFDHTTTKFALADKHAGLECVACHKTAAVVRTTPLAARVADYRGLQTSCVNCHVDVHQASLGATCETCHTARGFTVAQYTHQRTTAAFFAGLHAPVACEKCHKPSAPPEKAGTTTQVLHVAFKTQEAACVACHQDAHLGQLGRACESCHDVTHPKFAVAGFAHEKTRFPLTGKHAPLACDKCHKPERAAFSAGQGTATRFKPIDLACRTCHQDPHLGQLGAACEACHTAASFKLATYQHKRREARTFFVGRHQAAACDACHRPVSARFPAGIGTAVQYAVRTDCVACHRDVHNGSLGPSCGTCHKP